MTLLQRSYLLIPIRNKLQMEALTQVKGDLSAAFWVAKYIIHNLLKFPTWRQFSKPEYASSATVIFVVVLIAGKKIYNFCSTWSMMHSFPDIIKKTRRVFLCQSNSSCTWCEGEMDA